MDGYRKDMLFGQRVADDLYLAFKFARNAFDIT